MTNGLTKDVSDGLMALQGFRNLCKDRKDNEAGSPLIYTSETGKPLQSHYGKIYLYVTDYIKSDTDT